MRISSAPQWRCSWACAEKEKSRRISKSRFMALIYIVPVLARYFQRLFLVLLNKTIGGAAKIFKRNFSYVLHPDGTGWLVKRVE